ncbi:MAG: hypothetical protein HY876_03170 [Coriobacteriales bacterium]|nr:hypothetical protein [Coriobacteriales bacterium]
MLLAVVVLASVFSFAAPAPQAAAAPVYSYFPSASTTDGRMLSIAGDNLSTLSGSSVTLSFSVANTASSFMLGFFDGDDRSIWDLNQSTNFPTTYELYADPTGDGTGTTLVASWTEGQMTQNSWRDFPIATSSAARSPSGNYFYRLTVRGTTANATCNNFKVRVEGTTYITPTSIFGYIAMKGSGVTTDGAYNGEWYFNMIVPNGSSYVGVWDGDFDCGPSAGAGDTDDPSTPNSVPAWSPPSAQAEGAKGIGAPPDDNSDLNLRRSPNVNYEIILPDGSTFQNSNPSGTTEWEYFRLDTAPFDSSTMDYHVDSLPAGIYRVHVRGVDWQNLNALRFDYPIVGEDEFGNPAMPPAPCLVGDKVFNDLEPDGVQDPGEPGVAGVTLSIRDVVSGAVVANATTDASGRWTTTCWNGTYEVSVDASNYAPGGALEGFEPTTPGTRSFTVTDANVMTNDFGVRLVPRVKITPNRYASATPGDTITNWFTIQNNSGEADVIDISFLPDLGFPTEIRNSLGQPISAVALGPGESTSVALWMAVPAGTVLGTRDVTRLTARLSSEPTVTDSAIAETTVRAPIEVEPNNTGAGGPGTAVWYTHTVTNSTSATQTVALTATDSRNWPVAFFADDGVTSISNVTVAPNGGTQTVLVRVSIPSGTARGTTSTTTVRGTAGLSWDEATDVTTARSLLTYADTSYTTPVFTFGLDEDVFARATNLATSRNHYMRYIDPSGTLVYQSPSTSSGSQGVLTSQYHLDPADPTGNWTLEVRRSSNNALIESTTFEVVADSTAAISALYATNASNIGSNTTVNSTQQNQGSTTISNSSVDYRIWWDTNSDGTFNANDIYIDGSGNPVTYGGSGSPVTRTSTGITVDPYQDYDDAAWQMSNVAFPHRGTYNLTATWKTAGSQVIDVKTTTFFSVPTLGEWGAKLAGMLAPAVTPLLVLLLAAWAFVLVRLWSKRRWLLFYGLGALGTVLFALAISQTLGLDTRLAAVEARQVAWLAQALSMRIGQVGATGLAIQNHIGWGVFDIGIECSALLELATFVGLAAFYPTFDPLKKSSIVVTGLVATYLINLARILLIVGMVAALGTGWVFIAHAVVGRIFFFVGVVIVFWFLMTRQTVGVVRAQLAPAPAQGGQDV